jgi:CDP-diacylglycerol--glycerol-3-phosphate 3-phosphatidyltransferase
MRRMVWFIIDSIRASVPPGVKYKIPSALSFSRFVLTPAILGFLQARWWIWAAVLFIVGAVTDGLDGGAARLFDTKSKFGSYLDMIADKFLVAGVLLGLVASGRVSSWFIWPAFIILGREIIVLGLKLILASNGVDVEASIWGKAKMGMECIAITCVILRPWETGWFGLLWSDWMIVAAAMLSLQSGWNYFTRHWNELFKPTEPKEHRMF